MVGSQITFRYFPTCQTPAFAGFKNQTSPMHDSNEDPASEFPVSPTQRAPPRQNTK